MRKYIFILALLLPISIWANDSGVCGVGVTYNYDESTKTITVSGNGAMIDYEQANAPWMDYADQIDHIVIESGVTHIGVYAFPKCNAGTIQLNEGLLSIGNYAFYGCEKIEAITIPASVTSIYNASFSGCDGLTTIVVDENNAVYDSRNNCNAIISTSSNTLIKGCKNTIIPPTILAIGTHAFAYCSITTVVIPEGVTTIYPYAFAECSKLTSVTLPSTITSIGQQAFTTWNLGIIESKISDPTVISVAGDAFYGINYSNVILIIPNGTIAFYKARSPWSNIKSIITTDNIINGLIFVIEDGKAVAIKRISNYHDIVMPDSVTIDGVKYQADIEKGYKYNGRKGAFHEDDGVYSYTDPYVKSLEHADAGGLCYHAVNLKKASCVSLTSLGGGWVTGDYYCAFAGCTGLEEVEFPNLTSIGDMAMYGCKSLKTIDFPKLKGVSDLAFGNCGFKTANLPAVKSIGNIAFRGCDSLESIVLDNVETIGSDYEYNGYTGGAFYNCKSLKSISLPNIVSLKSTGQYSYYQLGNFQGCDSLAKVELGEKCERIECYTFKGCDTLIEVYCYAAVPPTLDATAFDSKAYENATLYVHAASYQAYKNAASWSKFNNIKTLEPIYKLTYMLDDEIYKEIETCDGDAITPEAAPMKEGYTFTGWEGLPNVMPAKDTIITGHFTINKYAIHYYVDAQLHKIDSVVYNAPITAITAPEKEGYTFLAWMSLPANMPAHDLNIDAAYSVNSYTLMFVIGNETIQKGLITYGTTITPPEAPKKEGMTFDKWENLPSTMPAKDTTIIGKYTLNVYYITYIVDGIELAVVPIEYSTVITPPQSEREGFTISWNAHPTTMPAYDLTIYGNYVDTSVATVESDNTIVGYYSLDGRPLDEPQEGINLIRYKNGSVRKIVVQ